MKSLIERSYKAIKDRGLITTDTIEWEFFLKMKEELIEVCNAYQENEDRYIEEVVDLATVCIMQIHHLGYDFEKEFEKVVVKNEKRVLSKS
jgi:NTP pyrophosphatase (non-canonical NTP hydrolase)